MLNADEVFEFSICFWPFITPVLIREIIADLRKPETKGRIPRQTVSALARKLNSAHGVQAVDFRKAAIGNLLTHDVPMIGQVPVDASAPNVHVSKDGRGVLYDSGREQEIWRRWEAGNFDLSEEMFATAFREGVKRVRLDVVRDTWKPFVMDRFADAKDLRTLTAQVDRLLENFSTGVQATVIETTLEFLHASPPVMDFVSRLFAAGLIPRMMDIAPYAASVARLVFIFAAGIGRGLIGPRPSHYTDLQYLFYAPFCMAFISSDTFHRDLWC